MAALVCVSPPAGLGEPAVLREDGQRQVWAEVLLPAAVQDFVTGEPLAAGWRCYSHADRHISVHTLKFIVTGNHAGSSHTGMF